MEYNFSNKVVLVTGASAGIGEATALLLAKMGARLSLVGRNEKNLKSVAERCKKDGASATLNIVADLGTDEGCEKTAKKTLEHFGRLDVLVNNAAIGAVDLIEKGDMAVFDKLFNVNLRSVYNLTRLLVPALIASKGNIVNVSSLAGTWVNKGAVSYSMAKAALDHFTRLIALELGPKGVRANTVSPGITISQFHQRMTGESDEQYQDFLTRTSKIIPLGEPCTSEDIGKMIVHIASDHSRMVTGTLVLVDGGLQFSSLGDVLTETLK
ncbi:3-oxoacyl-[acyl-carrier-protein] reductase FabG [Manduca sexta]|uniref:3-oxoacyl-[acyl-carrier-protein] reductase FabG n=1 Tax=Manduca sexta TaxID=7130 RepID=UPI00188EF556|nr:3-oxoacyl-[acyl-carrier-protein] reductase FabG [Manduca sexta]